jgi:hypothetical protein
VAEDSFQMKAVESDRLGKHWTPANKSPQEGGVSKGSSMRKRSLPFRLALLLTVVASLLSPLQAEEWSFVARLNRALDDIVPLDAKVEKLAGSFGFLEGPVWVR